MNSILFLTLSLSLSVYSQHYDKRPNLSRQVFHIEKDAREYYASTLIYGYPDEMGLQKPIYRIESFQDYLYRVVEIESGTVLNSYRSGAEVVYSRFGTYWGVKHPESPDVNKIYEITNEEPLLLCNSDIFHEGELIAIAELGEKFITLYSNKTLRCYSLEGKQIWSYDFQFGDLKSKNIFLSSDESLLVINIPDSRVIAVNISDGVEIWQFEGEYNASRIPYQFNPNILLYDRRYNRVSILDREGEQLYDFQKSGDLLGTPYLFGHQLVNRNMVIPNVRFEENRIILPVKLTSNNSARLVSPITWSTEGQYFVDVYAYLEKLEPPDSTIERYRVDVVSATGRSMGFFYPQIRTKLDPSNIKVQISNDGETVLFIGKESEGLQFIYREYKISL